MMVLTAITAIMAIYAVYLVMRHNMHMFQLNGYKNDEHIRWLGKNKRQQWLLLFGAALGVIRLFFSPVFLDILILLTLFMIIWDYRALRRLNNKKKLVFTPRVKRMMAVIILLSVAVPIIVFIVCGLRPLSGVFMIVVALQALLGLCANIINHPVETMISRHYINDARRILRSMPSLKVIGVTGSYGKTSVKYYLETLLKARYDVLVTPGNFNTPLGITRTIREHMKPSHEIFVCEMGARRVKEIKEICDLFPPDQGVITAVGPQHLETFHSIENIADTKFELADAVKGKGNIFLNGDNEIIRKKADSYPGAVMYGTAEDIKGYRAKDISLSNLGTEFTVVTPDNEEERFRMRLIGAHNVINVLGAIAVANMNGIPLKELKIPVRRIDSVEHRMQIKDQGNVTIIDDAYNSNPVGSKAAVETLAMFEGLRILITPGMVELGDKEEEYNYKFGTYAADCCDYIILVGEKHTRPIAEGIKSKNFPEGKLRVYERLEDALSYAYGIKDEGQKYILLENDLPDNY